MSEIKKINNAEVFSVVITIRELEPLIKQAARNFIMANKMTEKHAISSMDIISPMSDVTVQVVASHSPVTSIGVETDND